jgi:hypothetical protein
MNTSLNGHFRNRYEKKQTTLMSEKLNIIYKVDGVINVTYRPSHQINKRTKHSGETGYDKMPKWLGT